MTSRWLLPLITGVAVSCSGASNKGPGGGDKRTELTTKQIVDRATPSVVRIEAVRAQGGSGAEAGKSVGTGFVVGADGRIATNLHVIEGASEVTVQLSDKRRFPVSKVVAIDPARDLAILQISGASDLLALPIGNSDQVSAGEPVVIIGNPLGVLDFTVSDGLISSVRPLSEQVTVLQTSAPISQGSSGGPLFNNYGEVIGIATFFSTEGQNLNFAIPSNYLRPLLAQRGGLSIAEFAEKLKQARPDPGECTPKRSRIETKTPDGTAVTVERNVPCHEPAILRSCTPEQLLGVARSIQEAISKGAPIYNAGEHEACFVIYRKVATDAEGDKALCKGARDAFGQGLLRANTVDTFTEKAWALRDTFDGMLHVIGRELAQRQQQ